MQAAFKLLLVYLPVSQSPEIVVPVPKPAVIHHQHLNAQIFRCFGKFYQLPVVKVKESRFPAIDQQRAFFLGPGAAHQVLYIELMEGAAHASKALIGIRQHYLRGGENLSRLQAPAEVRGVYACKHPGDAPVIHLHINGKVAAVYQVQAVHLA